MGQACTALITVTLAALLLSGCARSSVGPADRAPGYLIRNVAILDPEQTTLSPLQDVLIIDDRIVAVSDDAGRRSPDGVRVIEGAGRVLAPGLIDMHVHIFDEAVLAASLVHGVTTVRNLGGLFFHLPMAERIENGRLAGPRLITTGTIINERGGRNANPLQTLISDPHEARETLRRQYRQGYRHLKLYSNLSRENFAAILAEARQLGMSVSGHPVEGTEADPWTSQGR